MATVVTPQATNQSANSFRSAVQVSQTRTGCASRSGGTATYISRAPISMPAACGSSNGRFSMCVCFGVRRLPCPGFAFAADFRFWLITWTGDPNLTLPPCALLVVFVFGISRWTPGSRQRPRRAPKTTLFGSESTPPLRSALLPLYGARILGPCSPTGSRHQWLYGLLPLRIAVPSIATNRVKFLAGMEPALGRTLCSPGTEVQTVGNKGTAWTEVSGARDAPAGTVRCSGRQAPAFSSTLVALGRSGLI